MTDISEALINVLSADSRIEELVGDRIYPMILPEDCSLPAIVYTPIYCDYDTVLGGDSGYVKQTVQIVCHDRTYKRARKLSRIVKDIIQDTHGDMGGLYIEAVFIKTDTIISGNTSLKFNTEEYMSSIEFDFYFNEKEN